MTEQTAADSPRRIDTAEVAKLVRRQLKKAFPALPARFFSVRIDRYSGGSSISVAWTDGPTEDRVAKIVHAFGSARFEGMSDCRYSADQWYCDAHGVRTSHTYGGDAFCDTGVVASRCCAKAELVAMGSGYVHETRTLSPEFAAALEAQVRREAGMDETVRDLHEPLPENSFYWSGDYSTVRDGVHRLSCQTAA